MVGWYDNAKVLKKWTRGNESNSYRRFSDENEFYSFIVRNENAFLIDVKKRNIVIPKATPNKTGYPGQSDLFYGSTNEQFVNQVIKRLDKNRNRIKIDEEIYYEPAEEFMAQEGRRLLRKHIQKERSSKLIKIFKSRLNDFNCSICGFNFENKYGSIGKKFIEAHHNKQIMNMKENEDVSIRDLISVCSNCHRMLHRKMPTYTPDEIKKMLSETNGY